MSEATKYPTRFDLARARLAKRDGCPRADLHTPGPEGYIAWHAWAKEKSTTHVQYRCPGCTLFKVWVPKIVRAPRPAPDGYAVGFTDCGKACHATPPGHSTALCGRYTAQAWSRQIDRDNLPVTCKRCVAALEALACHS